MARTKMKARKAASKKAVMDRRQAKAAEQSNHQGAGNDGAMAAAPPDVPKAKKRETPARKVRDRDMEEEVLSTKVPMSKKPRMDTTLADEVPRFGGPYAKDVATAPATRPATALAAVPLAEAFDAITNRHEDLYGLSTSHKVTVINIARGTSIQDKVAQICNILTAFSFSDPSVKPGLVEIHARGNAAAKLVSIVEIVKRPIVKSGSKLFQYSNVDGILTEHPAEHLNKKTSSKSTLPGGGRVLADSKDGKDAGTKEVDEMDVDDDFEQFEGPLSRNHPAVLQDPNRKKIKKISVITTFLSCVGVDMLKTACG
jgi:hypothetical protein